MKLPTVESMDSAAGCFLISLSDKGGKGKKNELKIIIPMQHISNGLLQSKNNFKFLGSSAKEQRECSICLFAEVACFFNYVTISEIPTRRTLDSQMPDV